MSPFKTYHLRNPLLIFGNSLSLPVSFCDATKFRDTVLADPDMQKMVEFFKKARHDFNESNTRNKW